MQGTQQRLAKSLVGVSVDARLVDENDLSLRLFGLPVDDTLPGKGRWNPWSVRSGGIRF